MLGSLEVPRPTLRSIVGSMLLIATALLAPRSAGAADAFRLGDAVRPSFQAVELRLDADADEYSGSTVIEIDVRQATRQIRLHAEAMQLQNVTLTSKAGAKPSMIASSMRAPRKGQRSQRRPLHSGSTEGASKPASSLLPLPRAFVTSSTARQPARSQPPRLSSSTVVATTARCAPPT